MNERLKKFIKENIPYYGAIPHKYRFQSNPVKDKAWSILSDYVRCRDVIRYGVCISSGERIKDWRYCDAGHFYSMSGHGALIGFHPLNIHAQSKNDNQLSSMHTGARFEKNLVKRYSKNILGVLDDLKNQTTQADDWFFANKIIEVSELFKKLEKEKPGFDYPDYIKKIR